jgi:hypothetical protein
MICEICFGLGEVLIDKAGKVVSRLADAALLVPCPDCGGSGFGYCCDGICAQPEGVPDGRPVQGT